MDRRPAEPADTAPGGASADPVTEAQLREPVEPVLAGRDPAAMDEAVGAHDGSGMAGQSAWSTPQGVGAELERDLSAGQASGGQGSQAGTTGAAAGGSAQGDRTFARGTTAVPLSEGGTGAAGTTNEVPASPGPGDVALLDLPRWTEHLRSLPTWRDEDRGSALLLRQPPVRVLLTALREGAEMGSDGAEETLMLLVMSGSASLEWREEIARLRKDELALVPAGGGWRVRSDADETVLLSVFWGTPGTGRADTGGR
jgi:hypothetical protein